MIAGAWLLAVYLSYDNSLFEQPLQAVRLNLSIAFWALYLLGTVLRPRGETRRPRDPSPRRSGVSVVVATGLAGTAYAAHSSSGEQNYVAAAAIALGTLVVAALVWRFATVHAGDIGEARFANHDRSDL
jgi:hypothetical protein